MVADLDGDGVLDAVVASTISPFTPGISVLRGTGSGTFVNVGNYSAGRTLTALAIGDFNGDHIPDLAAADFDSDSVSILLGSGSAAFGTSVSYSVGGEDAGPTSLIAADLDGDGALDLAFTINDEFAGNTGSISVLFGKGDGTVGGLRQLPTGSSPTSLQTADLDGDGVPDLTAAASAQGVITVLLGNHDQTTIAPTGRTPTGIATGDLDRDGKQDAVTANASDGTVSVLLGHGDSTFGSNTDFAAGSEPLQVLLADANGDGALDAIVLGVNGIYVLLGNGDGTLQAPADYTLSARPIAMAVADLDGDGRPDLAASSYGSDNLWILINHGDGTFAAPRGLLARE